MHTLKKDPRNMRGIFIRTTLLESFNSNSRSNWQLFCSEQLLLRKLKQECTDIREARPQQNSGKTPNRNTIQLFSHRPQAVALAGYQMIREEWCFVRGLPRNENNIVAISLSSEF